MKKSELVSLTLSMVGLALQLVLLFDTLFTIFNGKKEA